MYKLYSDNVITKGSSRDLLIDFGREKITLIPKEVSSFLEKIENGSEVFTKEEQELIDELIQKEIVFKISPDERDLFPKLEFEWDYPGTITNSIIEVTKNNISEIEDILKELEELNCFHYSIIINDTLSDENIDLLNLLLTNHSMISFELIVNYFRSEKLYEFLEACGKSIRMKSKIKIFNCNDSIFVEKFNEFAILKNNCFDKNCCGCIRKENFNVNIHLYSESQEYNSCLNRKISIDGDGNIKNCLSTKEIFGRIGETTLKDAIADQKFLRYWKVKKEEIAVCKDCEFRHICTDCRAFLENPQDIYSKPLKCGYDPYSNTWKEWSTNPLKQKAMDFYGIRKPIGKENV